MAASKAKGDDAQAMCTKTELEELKRNIRKLEIENRTLTVKAEGVQAVSELLKRSEKKANGLKRMLAEKTQNQVKGKQDELPKPSAYHARKSSASGSHDGQRSGEAELHSPRDSSPWKTSDSGKMQGLQQDELGDFGTDVKDHDYKMSEISMDENKVATGHSVLGAVKSDTMPLFLDNNMLLPSGLETYEYTQRKGEDSLDRMIDNDILLGTQVEKPASVRPRRTEYNENRQLNDTISQMKRSIADLESDIDCLKSEKAELVKINHSWEAQYRKLQEHTRSEFKNKDASFQKLQRQFSRECKDTSKNDLLNEKDAIIEQQAEKISALKQELGMLRADSMHYMQTRLETDLEKRYQRAKKLFQDQKKENEIILKREQAVFEECQMLKDAVEILERQTSSMSKRNRMLEQEITRLAGLIEFSAGKRNAPLSRSSPPSLTDIETRETRRQNSTVSAEQIEVLKQQIAVYAEDFNSEKEEKDSLVVEIKRLKEEDQRLKDKLRAAEIDAEDCRRQMQIFENDFRAEREERNRMSILQNIKEPAGYFPSPPSPSKIGSAEQLRQYQEYCQLVVERNKMAMRIVQLEQLGIDKFPQKRHDPFDWGFNSKGAGPATPSAPPASRPTDEMFFGGDVVKDNRPISRDHPTPDPFLVCRNCKFDFRTADAFSRHKRFCHH